MTSTRAPEPSLRAHPNSAVSLHAERTNGNLSKRCQQIVQAVRRHGPLTVRQIKRELNFGDMNAVRPRVTELVAAGVLTEVDSVTDQETGKLVLRVGLARPAGQGSLF